MVSMTIQDKTSAFLSIASQFKLGHLVTESFHPKTKDLSTLVKSDVRKAHALLQEVDADDDLEKMKPQDWKEITNDVFNELFKKSAVKRTKLEGLKRNIMFITNSKNK